MVARRKPPAGIARSGKAPTGRSFDPRALPTQQDAPQPAPAPGTPVGPDAMRRLKRRARRSTPKGAPTSGGPAQDEDQTH